jgi:protein-S-isoprenylcysteine O-methyltransferase Ste14
LLVKKGDHRLLKEACVKFGAGVLLVAILVFLPAGTLHYPGAWLLMAVLFIPMFFAGLVMWRKAPALLESRLQAKERESQQKQVIGLSALMFLGGFILAGLDHRYHWTAMPKWLSVAAAMVFLLGYLMFAEVLRENAYLSRTIQVQEGQKVVDTGLYGIVRHPMYFATVLLFLSIPLVLGSLLAFVIFLVYPFIIAKRIRHEEEFLAQELPGYEAYRKKVKYRMIPFVW